MFLFGCLPNVCNTVRRDCSPRGFVEFILLRLYHSGVCRVSFIEMFSLWKFVEVLSLRLIPLGGFVEIFLMRLFSSGGL